MATVKCAKIETTQVAFGAATGYGFTISIHSASEEFNILGQVDLNTTDGSLTAGEITTVNDFIALVTAQLLTS